MRQNTDWGYIDWEYLPDPGNPPNIEDVDRISLSWASGSGHGLSFIYDKLKSCFGDRFDMRLSVTKQKQTHVTVSLPE